MNWNLQACKGAYLLRVLVILLLSLSFQMLTFSKARAEQSSQNQQVSSAKANKIIYPKLIVKKLDAINTNEQLGDELYFDLTVIDSQKKLHYYRLPHAPLHIFSGILPFLSDIVVWSDALEPGETISLVLSLEEQDAAFLGNLDDEIGGITLTLSNDDGELKANMDELSATKLLPALNGEQSFILKGAHANYHLTIELDVN